MLTTEFISLNLYFAVSILAALVCFAVFWLIFDAWTIRRSRHELLKWAGFLILSLGFLVRAASLQTQSGGVAPITTHLAFALRLLGYLGIIAGQLIEPLQKRPDTRSLLPDLAPAKVADAAPPDSPKPATAKRAKAPRSHKSVLVAGLTGLMLPAAAGLVAALYWRRATTGLERHLRPVAYAFAGLVIFELLADLSSLNNVTNPNLYRLVAVYGPLWWGALIALAGASIILGAWVGKYLVKRFQSQLFMLFVAQTLIVFFCSTVGFTFLLLQNAQSQALADLATSSHVLQYAVTSLQAETAAQAEAVAANPAVEYALAARSHTALAAGLSNYMATHSLTTLIVTDASAQVYLRGEDPDRWGDSLSSDPLVRRALIGEAATSVVVAGGVIAPSVTLTAGRPIRDSAGDVIGSVTTGRAITGSFVDGIRTATGLDASVYGGNVLAATTLTAPGGIRAVGLKESSTAVTTTVLGHGHSYAGSTQLQNRAYLAAYAPLRDVNNTTVGMLLVARPADALFVAANRSIQLTFLIIVGLIILSIYPIFLVTRYLSRQLD